MSAKIGGVAWTSSAQTIATYQANGKTYSMVGAEVGLGGRAIAITLMNVDGPGTYTLGTPLRFRYANASDVAKVWETSIEPGAASSGTVVVSIATPTRFKATFAFTGVPAASTPSATGTKVVT